LRLPLPLCANGQRPLSVSLGALPLLWSQLNWLGGRLGSSTRGAKRSDLQAACHGLPLNSRCLRLPLPLDANGQRPLSVSLGALPLLWSQMLLPCT
jgi:hypothetical protein